MLPNKSLTADKLKKMRRFSSVGQIQYNKKIANTFDFKDLKELAKSADQESSNTSEPDDLEGKSLFVFGPRNKVRKWIKKLVSHPWFDYSVIAVILASSVTLALENPLNDPESSLSKNLEIINMTISFIF